MPAKKKSAWTLAAEAIKQQSAKTQEPKNSKTEELNTVIEVSPQTIKTEEPQNDLTVKQENARTVSPDSGITEDPIYLALVQNIEPTELQSRKADEAQDVITQEPQPATTEKPDSKKAAKRKSGKTVKQESLITDTEESKPTEKITLYLTWQQLDKLDQMALEYKRRTRKRTDHNKLLRMMVDKFDLEDLL